MQKLADVISYPHAVSTKIVTCEYLTDGGKVKWRVYFLQNQFGIEVLRCNCKQRVSAGSVTAPESKSDQGFRRQLISHLFSRTRKKRIFLFNCYLTFFRAPEKKRIFLFFLWGDLVQNRPRNPASASGLFSTRKSRSEVPERGAFEEKITWGRVGRTGQKKEKRMRKKRWVIVIIRKFILKTQNSCM